jgi:hypothetical protein
VIHGVCDTLQSHRLLQISKEKVKISRNIKIKIYRTTISLVVLYGCETWFLTLKEEYGLRICENRLLRGIYGPKIEELVGHWRKIHVELANLYSSPNIIRM